VAIEPEPRNFSVLLKNIRNNGLRNVIPLNLALSDKDGYELLSINPSPAGYSIVSSSSQRILVKARKIDTLLTELNIERVDLFKIDVEGAEMKVLKGGENFLKKGKPD